MLTIDRPHCAGRPTISKVRIHVNTTRRCLRGCRTKFVGSLVSNTYSIFANVWRSLGAVLRFGVVGALFFHGVSFRLCYHLLLLLIVALLQSLPILYCSCSNIFPRRICSFHEVNLHFVRNIGTSLSTVPVMTRVTELMLVQRLFRISGFLSLSDVQGSA